MPSRKTRWDEPVEMALNSGLQKIEGPFDALKYLTESWPAGRGMSFVKAGSACRAPLAGNKTAEEARVAFQAAAADADYILGTDQIVK